jgi:short-subunit dehydrogenase
MAETGAGAAAGAVAVITGAAGGIGGALARRFGAGGYRLALLDKDGDRLSGVADELADRGVEVLALECDLAETGRCEQAMGEVITAFGGVDVLINNAGLTHVSPLSETGEGVYRRLMEVNYFAALRCTKAALPSLIERRGRIVVVSSVAGFTPLVRRSGYSASKYALHGLFESLRAELRPTGVGVMMVCPGFTRTDIEEHALGGDGANIRHHRGTTGRMAEPAEVAEAVFRGLRRGRRLLVLSTVGKLSYLISRLAPSLYERLMLRTMARDEARARQTRSFIKHG